MTRKDYIKIADVIKNNTIKLSKNNTTSYATMDRYAFILEMCDVFKEDNSNFNKEKFFDACTFEDTEEV